MLLYTGGGRERGRVGRGRGRGRERERGRERGGKEGEREIEREIERYSYIGYVLVYGMRAGFSLSVI